MGKIKHKIIKDNPVPSIDVEKFRLFMQKKGFSRQGPILTGIIAYLEEFLQEENGVETDKEKPKCTCEVMELTLCDYCKG